MNQDEHEWRLRFALRINMEMDSSYEVRTRIADVANTTSALAQIAKSLHRLSELACERDLSTRELARELKLQDKARALATALGPGFEIILGSGDPRGAPLLLRVPSGYTDDFGDRGVVIPY